MTGLGLAAAGCATPVAPPAAMPDIVAPPPPPLIESPSTEARPAPAPATAPPPIPERPTVITRALVDRATDLEDAGSSTEAAAAIEQAIRIEPRRGDLWLQLAVLRLRMGLPSMAEQNARKALLFIAAGSSEERTAWLLIADARDAQDDMATAEGIRNQWIAPRD